MKRSGRTLLFFGAIFLVGYCWAKSDFERLFEKAKKEIGNAVEKNSASALTNNEVIDGLKEALRVGAKAASSKASMTDGFFKNVNIKIPMPDELRGAESFLNRIGLKKVTQDFTESMNHGAEVAAKLAVPIFVKSITKMTFQDAKGILSGKENAATEFLKRTSTPELTTAFLPVVDKSLKKVDATKYWKDITTTYNSMHLFSPLQTDLNQYVTGKALDGLFFLMADEEKEIRRDPLGQASAIIRKVFGSQSN